MRTLAKLTWVELKLFAREPFAVIFTFAFPLIVLVVLIGSFEPDDDGFGGIAPANYYLASYVGVVIAAVGLIAMPVHLATYFERGVLMRFRASAIPLWATLGSQVIVGFLMAIVGSVFLTIIGKVAYGANMPDSIPLLVVGFVIATLTFLAFGLLIAVITRGARSAQAVGLMLFFPMFLLGGAGPPPTAMSNGMRTVSDWVPLTYVGRTLQPAWFDGDMAWRNPLVLVILLVAAIAVAAVLYRRAPA